MYSLLLLSYFATRCWKNPPWIQSPYLNLLKSYNGGTSKLNGLRDILENGGWHFLLSWLGTTIILMRLKK
uniref:NP1 n=1 Tax=Meleagris gallopavo enteric parvovirus TaxID=1633570 RepID=A0A0D5ZDH1_9VIRU|nr:NP1 [Meleagris gallopavo enteric parvovirus]